MIKTFETISGFHFSAEPFHDSSSSFLSAFIKYLLSFEQYRQEKQNNVPLSAETPIFLLSPPLTTVGEKKVKIRLGDTITNDIRPPLPPPKVSTFQQKPNLDLRKTEHPSFTNSSPTLYSTPPSQSHSHSPPADSASTPQTAPAAPKPLARTPQPPPYKPYPSRAWHSAPRPPRKGGR